MDGHADEGLLAEVNKPAHVEACCVRPPVSCCLPYHTHSEESTMGSDACVTQSLRRAKIVPWWSNVGNQAELQECHHSLHCCAGSGQSEWSVPTNGLAAECLHHFILTCSISS